MSALPLIITTAGTAALVNAANTGTDAVVISQVGVSATAMAATTATTAITAELKRIATIAGQVVADDTFHIAISDQSTDTYSLRTIGLYLDDGTLFAVYSQALPIAEKASPAILLLNGDIKLTSPLASVIEFGDSSFSNPPASETVVGVMRVATAAEVAAGLSHVTAVTPLTLKGVADGKADKARTIAGGGLVTGGGDLSGNRTLSVTEASDAEALAGTDGSKVITPRRLATAIAGKSNTGHQHAASDTTSGVFDVMRIPDLVMTKITGLVAALAGKAATAHSHAAADVTSGVFDVLRIPDLALAKITGLVAALAGKAATVHTHAAGDVTSGTFDVLRIPDLALAKITGLVAELTGKVAKAGDTMTGSLEIVTAAGQSVTLAQGALELMRTDGQAFIDFKNSAAEDYDARLQLLGNALALTAPGGFQINGGGAWHTGNFNPAAKATLGQAAEFGDIAANRGNGTGAYYFAAFGGSRYLYFNGSNFDLVGGQLFVPSGVVSGGSAVWTTGLLQASSAAEAAAGAATDRFLTPAALFSFTRLLNNTGYAVIPGTGLMLQWGRSILNAGEGFVDATLPVAFGGGCMVAVAVPSNAAGQILSDYYMQAGTKFLDRITFFANRANAGSGNLTGFEWIALGRVAGSPDPAYAGNPGGGQ